MEEASESTAAADPESPTEPVVDFQSLIAITSLIFEDQLRMRSAGIEVRGWTPDRERGVVQLRVASDPDEAQMYVDQAYGHGRVEVVRTANAPLTRLAH